MKNDKKYFDIADELFQKKETSRYAKINKFNKNGIMINETTFLSSSNPFNKEKGTYCSFVFDNLEYKKTYDTLTRYLKKYLHRFVLDLTNKEKPSILFVGLGNENYIPDSLGPKVVNQINANYFFKKQIGCLTPGVMATTGMETSDIIKGVLKTHEYDLVIVIDSLATSSIYRLNKTIQITDTGIQPGSGVNNYRKRIDKKELKTSVLTIGIATVISYRKIIEEYLSKNQVDLEVNFDSQLVLTSKEIEHEIDYLTLILSEVLNDII